MAEPHVNGTTNGAVPVADVPTAKVNIRRPLRGLNRLKLAGKAATSAGRPQTFAAGTILPPPSHDMGWRQMSLDTDSLNRASPSELLEYLANLSPEVSKGLWDYQRLLNPGWSFECFNPGTETSNARARKIVDAALDVLKQKHGSVDVVLGRMHMGAYMRGGYFGEIILADNQRDFVDVATPDPASVRFKVIEDAETRQQRWQLGQWQERSFVPLDEEPGVTYIPVDPFPGNPYGRPLVAPAIFSALFLIGLLHDLRRVISQQGWPRIDIVVFTQKLLEGLDVSEQPKTPEEVEAKIAAAIDDVQYVFKNLQPDEAYIHSDDIEIKGPIGVTAGANLSGIEGVIDVVERMLVRALKTMPLMLGITDGVSEANANRQWEILVAGVKSMQHLAESMLERFFELLCQANGIQANVVWAFAEIRAAEAQRDALTYSQEIDNQLKLRNAGIIDQEEAAMNTVGHPPAEEEQPAFGLPTDDDEPPEEVQDNDENPDPGETKWAPSWARYVHEVRPVRIQSRSAYRRFMREQGYGVRKEVRKPSTGFCELLPSFSENGESFSLVSIRRDAYGEDCEGLYDVFFREVARS